MGKLSKGFGFWALYQKPSVEYTLELRSLPKLFAIIAVILDLRQFHHKRIQTFERAKERKRHASCGDSPGPACLFGVSDALLGFLITILKPIRVGTDSMPCKKVFAIRAHTRTHPYSVWTSLMHPNRGNVPRQQRQHCLHHASNHRCEARAMLSYFTTSNGWCLAIQPMSVVSQS